MNGEIKKERNQTTGLIIINALIWIPLLIMILLIIGVAKVNAESYTYRQRVWDAQDTLLNDNYSSGISGSGKAYRFYTNITRDSNIQQGQYMNIYINYAIAYRFSNADVNTTIRYIDEIMYVYNSNTYDITNSCTRTQVIERESGESNFNRFNITISCTNIPAQENINAILVVSRPYGNLSQMAYATNVTYALQVNDVWIKSNNETTETDKILINNNENFNKLMEENAQNTQKVIDSIQEWEGADQPNTNTSESAFNKESQIIESLEMDVTLERPQIDTTANNLIWEWVHRLLFTNTIIAGVTITLLTFGVIKLILGR